MWKALTLLLVMALAGAGYYLLTPGGRQLIDRVYINWTRAEYQARFRAGGTLPGTPDLARLDERRAVSRWACRFICASSSSSLSSSFGSRKKDASYG